MTLKPSKGDRRYQLRFEGEELGELERLHGCFFDSYGLDRKLRNYQGKRPLTLFDWDLDLLTDVLSMQLASLAEPTLAPLRGSDRTTPPNPVALRSLLARVLALRPGVNVPARTEPATTRRPM